MCLSIPHVFIHSSCVYPFLEESVSHPLQGALWYPDPWGALRVPAWIGQRYKTDKKPPEAIKKAPGSKKKCVAGIKNSETCKR